MVTPIKADLVIRAKEIHSLQPQAPPYRSLALHNGRVWSLSEDLNGLDSCIGPDTRVLHEPDQIVLPAFDDTHTHMIFAGLSQFDVPVHLATCIDEMIDLLKKRAAETEPGSWITTTANWQEFNLKEQRFPTVRELDQASSAHPIVLKRGGHNIVVNSLALERGGITTNTQTPQGGKIGRNSDGSLNGQLQDQAMMPILYTMPHANFQDRIQGLESASAAYAAVGIGCVRDCAVPIKDIPLLMATRDAGKLHVRTRALVSSIGLTSASAVVGLLDQMEQYRHLQRDEWLSIWGVKFVLDGGIEANATREPYVGRPEEGCCGGTDFCGVLMWEPNEMVEAMDAVLRRGWRIGTHAYGDRAIDTLLSAYEQLQHRHPHLPPGTLVMEHGGLADSESRARTVAMGIPVTIQLPLLYDVAAIQALYLGEERTARIFPAREWLDSGALLGGGSDYPVGRFGAMRSVWGMMTRDTVAGVVGPEHVIRSDEAIAMHTTKAAELLRESDFRGDITPGKFADVTIWPQDPLAVGDPYVIRDLEPTYTIVGGHIKHASKVA